MRQAVSIVVVLVLVAAGVSAQGIAPISVSVGGGLSLPSGDFEDQYDNGFNVGLAVGINVAPMLQLSPKLEYHSLKLDENYWLARAQEVEPSISEVGGGRFRTFLIGADLHLRLPVPLSPIRPFALGGGGWANIAVSDFEGTEFVGELPFTEDSEDKFYWNIGGGLEFGGPLMSFFVQARYVNINTDGEATTMIPLTAGIKF